MKQPRLHKTRFPLLDGQSDPKGNIKSLSFIGVVSLSTPTYPTYSKRYESKIPGQISLPGTVV
jgi:hypothetical protein